jgi:hypothetical protein
MYHFVSEDEKEIETQQTTSLAPFPPPFPVKISGLGSGACNGQILESCKFVP